jgi:peptidoglycan/xylan/chitin deacetylase (PgdA/CDA1 family)
MSRLSQLSQRGKRLALLAIAILPLLALLAFVPEFRSVPMAAFAPTPTATPPPSTPTPTPSSTATRMPTATRTPRPSATPTVTATPSRLADADAAYVPVLMYHYIRTVDEQADPMGYRLSITPERFAEQMEWLRDNDYTPMRMDALSACLRGLTRCPENPVALTFDDGYTDAATEALPVLEEQGFVATFYVVVNFVGKPGYMTWEQIELLRDSGMEIGSHTVNHFDLTGLELDAAQDEIVTSRQLLEERLEVPVVSFSYPVGSYNSALAGVVRSAGYTNAVIVMPGDSITHMYEIPRRRVLGGESIAGFPWYMVPVE